MQTGARFGDRNHSGGSEEALFSLLSGYEPPSSVPVYLVAPILWGQARECSKVDRFILRTRHVNLRTDRQRVKEEGGKQLFSRVSHVEGSGFRV
jgi:hypothetical protein